MAASAMTSFDSLSDEIALKIIAMAAPKKWWYDPELKYNHDFLIDVLCEVSIQFRRLATDSSLWKDSVYIHIPMNDFRKLDFVIRETLNSGTKALTICLGRGYVNIRDRNVTFPNRYLIDLATNFTNLKRVNLRFFRPMERDDIPAPWELSSVSPMTIGGMLTVLTRD